MIGQAPLQSPRESSWSDIDDATRSVVMTDYFYNPDIAFSTTTGYVYPLINLKSANQGGHEITETPQSARDSSLAIPLNGFDVPSATSFADGAFDFNEAIYENLVPHPNYGWGNTLQSNSDPRSGQSIDSTSTLMSPSITSDRDWRTPSPEIASSDIISESGLLQTPQARIGVGLNFVPPNSLSTPMNVPGVHMAEDDITTHSFFALQQVHDPSMYVLGLRCEGFSRFQFDHGGSYPHRRDASTTPATTRLSCIHTTRY